MTRCVGAFLRVCFTLTDRQLCDACYADVRRAFNPSGHRGGRPQPRPRLTAKGEQSADHRPAHLRRPERIDWGQRLVSVPFRGDVD